MGVDLLDFPVAQPKELSATSGRILQRFRNACGVGKKKRKGQKSNHGIFRLFMAMC